MAAFGWADTGQFIGPLQLAGVARYRTLGNTEQLCKIRDGDFGILPNVGYNFPRRFPCVGGMPFLPVLVGGLYHI
ncbi:hypothetical protein SAMN05421740_11469 [Parapedobacter koreensis]|uniref:Uncharacterized protein n=1 Tax=Parapedobacter koreensis TaxID=332977 RepID=A0A1H7UBG4_9SPHI|nr:hypothetical protein SAMN05421740_11469 [Parapedobacter koreensis]